jgi:adenylate cyclase
LDDSSPTRIDVEDTVDWLVDGVRSVKVSEDILRELCARLTKAGLPLYCVAVFVTTLHPNVAGRGFFWREDREEVEVAEASYEVLNSEQYFHNPIYAVYKEGKEIRRRICDPDCPNDYLILDEFP